MKAFKILVASVCLSAAASAFAQVGGGNSSVGTGSPASRIVRLSLDDSRTLWDILRRARIPRPSNQPIMVGSTNITVNEAYCTRVVYPGALGNCRLTVKDPQGDITRQVVNQDGEDLFGLISKYVGLRPFTEVGVGAGHAAAVNVFCGMPVVPNAVPHCQMERYPSSRR